MKKLLNYLSMAVLLCALAFTGAATVEAAEEAYTVKGQTYTVNVKSGADISDNVDDTLKAARDAATSAKPITVVIPKGSYKLTETLHIYSNTTLDARGVTLTYSGSEDNTMLMSGTNGAYGGYDDYNSSKACAGYKGFENITVKGGTWKSKSSNTSTILRFSHGKNITLDGVTVSGGGCTHQVEVAAIDGFYVKNCTFKDFGDKKANEKQEALQLDVVVSENGFRGVYQDGTLMKNVEVTGCTFDNVPRGVGSHTLQVGGFFKNVKINNNTFVDVWEEAVTALNYVDCEIKDNTITNCGGGVLVQYFKATPETIYTTIFDGKKAYKGEDIHDANTVVSGNVITTKYVASCDEIQGVKVYGLNVTTDMKGGDGKKIPQGHYYISNVTVENNTITTAGNGIHLMDVKDCVVKDNKITQAGVSSSDPNRAGYDGIFVEKNVSGTSVTGNSVKNMKGDGIFVQESAYVTSLSGNTISGCGRYGINFFQKSGTTEDIVLNNITNCKSGGMMFSTSCKITNITNNVISLKVGDAFFNVYKKSNVGSIKDNTLTNNSTGVIKFGFKLTSSATVAEITNNIMSATKGGVITDTGILVDSKSKVTSGIKSNTIGKSKTTGIKIVNGATVKGISSNKLTTTDNEYVANNGILVDKSTVSAAISKNQIGKVKTTAIKIANAATTKAISSNKIIAKKKSSNVANTGILVDNKSKVNGNINKNEIGKVKTTAIKIAKSSTTKSITENKIMGAKASTTVANTAILLDNKAKVSGSISKNTIGTVTGTAIKLAKSQVTGSIESNDIATCKGDGILVYNSSKVGKDITKNKIKKARFGVSVITKSTVKGSIKKNTIKKATSKKVNVDKTSKGKVKK